jgi:hypothetical protein
VKIKQYVPLAPTIQKGDVLLWFLPRPTSKGLVSPVGITSGSFRLSPNPDVPGSYLAVNDQNNRGLWDPDKTLWQLYDLEAARDLLHTFGEPKDELIQEIVFAGNQLGSKVGPVPLELIKLIIHLSPIPQAKAQVRP